MDVEWWKAARRLPTRDPLCGHVGRSVKVGTRFGCQICGIRHGIIEHRHRPTDRTPTGQLQWDNAKRTRARHITPRKYRRGAYQTLEELLSEVSTQQGCRFDLDFATLRPSQQNSQSDNRSFIVWRAAAEDCVVMSGSIALPDDGILLMHGHGAHFRNITFSGGVVMCAGADYSGTFQDCKFRECELYAVHAAAVTIRFCNFERCGSAVVGSGSGTAAQLEACSFLRCSNGVVVEGGGAVAARRCLFADADSCVVVNGSGSRVDLARTGMDGGARMTEARFGAVVCGGALSMTGCFVSQFVVAVRCSGHQARLEMHDSFCDGCETGVVLMDTAAATLREVDVHLLETARQGDADLWALGVGGFTHEAAGIVPAPDNMHGCARLQAERCSIQQGAYRAVSVTCGGLADMRLCRVHSHDRAIVVHDTRSRAVFSDSELLSAEHVCSAEKGRVTMLRCRMVGGQGILLLTDAVAAFIDTACHGGEKCIFAITPLEGSRLWVVRCHVRHAENGVMSHASECTLVDTHFSNMYDRDDAGAKDYTEVEGGGAACMCMGGTLHMRGGSVRECGQGIVVRDFRDSGPGTAYVTGVSFDQVEWLAVSICLGCWAELIDCDVRGNFTGGIIDEGLAQLTLVPDADPNQPVESPQGIPRRFASVSFRDACGGAVRSCRFEGSALDLVSWVSTRLDVFECVFWGHGGGTGMLTLDERSFLHDCTFHGTYQRVGGTPDALTCYL